MPGGRPPLCPEFDRAIESQMDRVALLTEMSDLEDVQVWAAVRTSELQRLSMAVSDRQRSLWRVDRESAVRANQALEEARRVTIDTLKIRGRVGRLEIDDVEATA